eukprot:gene3529-3770_t
MSDNEYYEEMDGDEPDAAYDSDYAYESDGIRDEEDVDDVKGSGVVTEEVGNSFHVLMDPEAQTTEEWRAIFSQLRNLVVRSVRKVNYEWDSKHEENFRTAIIYVESLKERSCFYPFRINFHATKEISFPEVPPQIQPLFSLPAPLFVMIMKHPLLTAKNWNPCQDLLIIVDFIVSFLDTQIDHLETVLLSAPVAGGNLSSFIRSAEEANKWLDEPITDLAIEHLVSFIYGYYMFEIPYHPDLLDQFVRGERVLTACPLNLKKELPKYSGIGYSRDASYASGRKDSANTAKQSQSAVSRVFEILKLKFEYFLQQLDNYTASLSNSGSNAQPMEVISPSINFERDFTPEVINRFVTWFNESPLLFIIQRKVEQFASGDMIRETNETSLNFELTLLLEKIFRTTGFTIDANLETLFIEIYKKLYSWIKMDLFTGDESQAAWIVKFKQQSVYLQQIINNESAFFTSNGKLSAEEGEHPAKIMKLERNQVVYVSGLEKNHTLYSSFSAEKCSKFFLKELKTLNESLPDEVTVFVSEEHPNYLMAVFSITNTDSPYYGGMYLFHISIPDTYPNVSPKVQFMTTGYGSVRFNPNLYNNGKVCLSLLGTWSGEPWDPKNSNLNQVLSSILFLIFTEEPFYNEPGYDRDGRKHSKESQAYDGTVIGNVVSYAILDHLVNPYPVKGIYEHIKAYFARSWSTIEPVLRRKLNSHKDLNTLSRPWETLESELTQINSRLRK